jgi:hypothetical protein
MRQISMLSASLLLATTPAMAADIRSCEGFEVSASNLIFPVEENVRSFANGDIRVIGLDTGGEPVCCSSHVMVLLPSPEDPGDICVLVSAEGTNGWYSVSVGATKADYDAETGLTLRIPVGVYNGAGSDPDTLTLVINQPRGTVTPQ